MQLFSIRNGLSCYHNTYPMKNLFINLLFLLSVTTSWSQHQYIKNYNDDVYNLIPCQDSTFYSIALHPGCGINNYTLRYFNRAGNVARTMDAPITVAGMSVFDGTTDASSTLTMLYYALGYNVVQQTDTSGNLHFCRSFNPNGYEFYKILPGDQSFYLCGYKVMVNSTDSLSSVIVKINHAGYFQWAKKYTMPGYKNFVLNDFLLRNDSLLVGGYFNNGQSPLPSYPYLAMLDTAGVPGSQYTYVIDSSMFLFEPYKITDLDFYDNDILYGKFRASSGVDCIMRLDGQLQPIWTKSISGELGLICATYEGGVLFNTPVCYNSGLVKLDPSGAVAGYSANSLTGSQGTAQAGMVYRLDCGYLIGTPAGWPADLYSHIPSNGGYCDGSSNAPSIPIYPLSPVIRRAVSVNSDPIVFSMYGGLPTFTNPAPVVTTYCSAPYSCEGSLGLNELQLPLTLPIYPNPASSTIHIPVTGTETVFIRDAFGQLVYSGTTSSGTIAIGHLAPGVYFLQAGEKTGRFVRE